MSGTQNLFSRNADFLTSFITTLSHCWLLRALSNCTGRLCYLLVLECSVWPTFFSQVM